MTAERIAWLRKAVERYDWDFQPSRAELIELLDLATEALRLREALKRIAHDEATSSLQSNPRKNPREIARAALSPRGENEETK